MFDVGAFKAFLEPLGWFLTLGKTDTKHMRNEIEDLLFDTRKSIQSLIEIEQILASLKKKDFNKDSYWDLYLHCTYTYTGNDASEKARTHCTDIIRDTRRISFKAAKVLRTEWGQWKSIGEAFRNLEDADQTFLDNFADALRALGKELDAINGLFASDGTEAAWERFEKLRADLRSDVQRLGDVTETLRKADDHIRKVLT